MTQKHTPGPWSVIPIGDRDNGSDFLEIHDGFGRTATVYGEGAEANATARLIASAPDLLAALEAARQALVECADHGLSVGDEINAIDLAIATATQGESQ